jgi:hypothetical protein
MRSVIDQNFVARCMTVFGTVSGCNCIEMYATCILNIKPQHDVTTKYRTATSTTINYTAHAVTSLSVNARSL